MCSNSPRYGVLCLTPCDVADGVYRVDFAFCFRFRTYFCNCLSVLCRFKYTMSVYSCVIFESCVVSGNHYETLANRSKYATRPTLNVGIRTRRKSETYVDDVCFPLRRAYVHNEMNIVGCHHRYRRTRLVVTLGSHDRLLTGFKLLFVKNFQAASSNHKASNRWSSWASRT